MQTRDGHAIAIVPCARRAPAVAGRMAVHIYQGPLPVVGFAAVGGAWGVYYYRTRRIWPVVLAHGLLDFVALTRMDAGVG